MKKLPLIILIILTISFIIVTFVHDYQINLISRNQHESEKNLSELLNKLETKYDNKIKTLEKEKENSFIVREKSYDPWPDTEYKKVYSCHPLND